jgi:hypothetical protein
MFMFDIETLDAESTAVILSASIIHFEIGEQYTYEDLLARALFVKFDAREQMEKYKRTTDKGTLDWWAGMHDYVKKTSLAVYPNDLPAIDGINAIKSYMAKFPEKDQTMWSRGSLDQMAIDSLCKATKQELIAPYYVWRDVRTAVDLLTDTGKGGYCDVVHPTFQRHNVIKHHPTHDCALDIMMLIYGK